MSRMTGRERRILTLTVAVGLLAVAQMVVVRPLTQRIGRARVKAQAAAQTLAQMEATAARRASVEVAYEAVRSRITSNRTPEDEVIDILLTVEEAAKKAGVEVLQNTHEKDDQYEYFDLHTVKFRGRGKPESLMRMIHALQNPQLLLKIPEMKFAMKNYQLEVELDITRVVSGVGKDG